MTPDEILNLFFYRSYPFAIKTQTGIYIPVWRNVTIEDIIKHLRGYHTIGAYQSRSDETCTWACIDFDDKKYESTIDSMIKLINTANKVEDTFIDYVMKEKSENRGYHLWIFFKEPTQTLAAYKLVKCLLTSFSLKEGRESKIDIFPKSPTLTGKRLGGLVRIPTEEI